MEASVTASIDFEYLPEVRQSYDVTLLSPGWSEVVRNV